jgi:hypothetical protein
VKIAGIQKRREELDEEMCDLLNQKLTEHDRQDDTGLNHHCWALVDYSVIGASGLRSKLRNRNEERQNHSASGISRININ